MRRVTTSEPERRRLHRINLAIPAESLDRLDVLARAAYRDRRQQASLLLVEAIERAEAEPGEAKR